jgi:hypothetical protein
MRKWNNCDTVKVDTSFVYQNYYSERPDGQVISGAVTNYNFSDTPDVAAKGGIADFNQDIRALQYSTGKHFTWSDVQVRLRTIQTLMFNAKTIRHL